MKVNINTNNMYKIIISFDFFIVLIIIFSIEFSKTKAKEYTNASHFFLNIYIIIIFLVLLWNTFFPRYKTIIITKYFKFITSKQGKTIIIFLISMIFRFSESLPHFILGLLLFFSSLILFILEILVNFESKNYDSQGNSKKIYNDNIINDNNFEENNQNNVKSIDTINESNYNNDNNSSSLELEKKS